MEELYVVGSNGVESWVCCNLAENELMSKQQAIHTANQLNNMEYEFMQGTDFRVAKLSWID